MRRLIAALRARPRLLTGLQVGAFVVLIAFLGYSLRHSLVEAGPRLRDADRTDMLISLLLIAAYYLSFAVGWQLILRALGVRLGYRQVLRAEMLSMLAKYIPGGVWTPAARVVAARRAGVDDASLVLASIGLEAGLSAVAGVVVFVASLPTVESTEAPVWWLVGFALALVVLLHPRVFGPVASFILRPLGARNLPSLGYMTTILLVAYYSCTWLLGGAALFFMLRAVGGDPPASSIPYLGGTSAVGAIVAGLVVFAPSGLGVREGSMYALLRAVVPGPVALSAVLLNRVAITLVEAVLFAVTYGLPWRRRGAEVPEERPKPGPPSTASQGP